MTPYPEPGVDEEEVLISDLEPVRGRVLLPVFKRPRRLTRWGLLAGAFIVLAALVVPARLFGPAQPTSYPKPAPLTAAALCRDSVPGHLKLAMAGIAVDGEGNVFVANPGREAIQKLSARGKQIHTWGCLGTLAGQFDLGVNEVAGVAVNQHDDTVYVADSENQRVEVFDHPGHSLHTWKLPGSEGNAYSPPVPVAVAVGNGDDLYVVDFLNDRVVKFDTQGRVLADWGGAGRSDGHFALPDGIAVDSLGDVYVADRDNNRIQKFDPDGHFLLAWGRAGRGNGQFAAPAGIAVDGLGDVYVADRYNNRIQKFDPGGHFLGVWADLHVPSGQRAFPTGIALGQGDQQRYVIASASPCILQFASGSVLSNWTC
jgi:DNA-binding beta-propeller fold protein YncE